MAEKLWQLPWGYWILAWLIISILVGSFFAFVHYFFRETEDPDAVPILPESEMEAMELVSLLTQEGMEWKITDIILHYSVFKRQIEYLGYSLVVKEEFGSN